MKLTKVQKYDIIVLLESLYFQVSDESQKEIREFIDGTS